MNKLNEFSVIQNRSELIASGFINKPQIINQENDIEKAHVKAHQRKTKSGKLVQVKEYEDKRQKKYLNKKIDFNKFKDKEGDFYCSYNKLTSLKGAPKIVKGGFSCSFNKLTSLEGAPKIVEGDFYCGHNKLTSLKGSPKIVEGDFNCFNNKLTSLEGAPKEVNGDFYCYNNIVQFTTEDVQKVCKVSGKIYLKPKYLY